MARGAPFVTGRTSGGFVAVKLPGIGGDGLWLAQSELATAATPVPRPADPPPPETARERRRRLTDIPVSATAGVP
jgi:hypothetical protein